MARSQFQTPSKIPVGKRLTEPAHETMLPLAMHVVFATDDANLYRALSPQACGLLYCVNRLQTHNLDAFVEALMQHTVDLTPRIS